MREYLDQVGLCACLWGTTLIKLTEVGRFVHCGWDPEPHDGGESKQSTSIHHLTAACS